MRLSAYVSLLGALLVLPVLALAAELVSSPNSARAWTFDIAGGAAATIREEDGGLRVDISRVNGQNWCVQAFQAGKHAREGAQYTIRFKAKASTARSMVINCQIDKAPWRSVLASMPTANLTTQWQTYSFPINFRNVGSDTLAIPQFMLGDAIGTVWIKDVSVNDGPVSRFNTVRQPTPVPTTQVAAPTTAPAEVLLDPTNTANWRFEAQPDTRATFVSEAGVLRIDVQQAGTERWHVQLYQTPEALSPGTYICSLTVRSTTPRKLSFMIEHNVQPYEKLIPYTDFAIGSEWKEYKIRFTIGKTYPGETRAPLLQMGDTAGTVYMRAISLMRVAVDAK